MHGTNLSRHFEHQGERKTVFGQQNAAADVFKRFPRNDDPHQVHHPDGHKPQEETSKFVITKLWCWPGCQYRTHAAQLGQGKSRQKSAWLESIWAAARTKFSFKSRHLDGGHAVALSTSTWHQGKVRIGNYKYLGGDWQTTRAVDPSQSDSKRYKILQAGWWNWSLYRGEGDRGLWI